MQVRATSRLLAVIGDPVGHSLSPAMHNAAINALGLDAVFLALRSSPAAFEALVRSLLAAGGAACVTVPHKREAARLLDQPSELVRRTGACNAIWPQGGRVAGDNTDVTAVRDEARRLLAGRRPLRSLLLGTGGSARAAAVALAEEWPGSEVAVVSRSAERAAEFAAWAADAGVSCRAAGAEERTPAELVVNATPLGLRPDDPLPLTADQLQSAGAIALLDLVYARGETALVRAARERGVAAADGRGVLVAQGAAAFERFFGVEPPREIMRAAVEDALRP
jgi:shikimate dehydrogenase